MLAGVLAALVAATGAAPAAATLVFDRHPATPSVYAAADDGTGVRRIGPGSRPRISPDGATVVYQGRGSAPAFRPDLFVAPADGSAPPRRLARGWPDTFTCAWTPDARSVVTVIGPELGPRRLVVIDVATGVAHTLARGSFSGATLSPDGATLLYARNVGEDFRRSDLYRVAVAGGTPVRVTSDHRSAWPLWGPAGGVVYVRRVDAAIRRYGPKNELYVAAPDGTGPRRLTRTTVAPLLTGLVPTAWSADGTRLLADFGGQDTSYAVTVNPVTGAHRPLVRAAENGVVGADLSADGTTVLATTGGPDRSGRHDIVAISYEGGPATLLVRNAADPDWSR
jgi:Tol biopolymer transport system component